MRAERPRAAATALAFGLVLAVLVPSQPAAAHETVREWSLTARDASTANFHIAFETYEPNGSHRVYMNTSPVPYATIRGLTAADVAAPSNEKRFQIAEDPGTLTFSGSVGNGCGKGTYDFTSDPAFQRALAHHGMRPATDVEGLELALQHFKASTLDDVVASGVQAPTPADLVTMADHGVSAEYLRGFKGIALQPKTAGALAQLRDHGVTPAYVQAFASAGYRPISIAELTMARDHGVDAKDAYEIRAAMPSLSMSDLATLRDHGVKPSLVAALARSSYRDLRVNEITLLADHGVSGQYVTEFSSLGYHPAASDLALLHDHGVSTTFIQRLRSHGYGAMSTADIIKLYEHGI
jgi:hypothetical protein